MRGITLIVGDYAKPKGYKVDTMSAHHGMALLL